jgi:hypothetical protein
VLWTRRRCGHGVGCCWNDSSADRIPEPDVASETCWWVLAIAATAVLGGGAHSYTAITEFALGLSLVRGVHLFSYPNRNEVRPNRWP